MITVQIGNGTHWCAVTMILLQCVRLPGFPLPMNLRLKLKIPLTLVLSPGGERKSRRHVFARGSDLLSPWWRGWVRGVFGSRAQCIRKRTYGVLTLILSPAGPPEARKGEEIAAASERFFPTSPAARSTLPRSYASTLLPLRRSDVDLVREDH